MEMSYTHDEQKNNIETNEVDVKFILTKMLPCQIWGAILHLHKGSINFSSF